MFDKQFAIVFWFLIRLLFNKIFILSVKLKASTAKGFDAIECCVYFIKLVKQKESIVRKS